MEHNCQNIQTGFVSIDQPTSACKNFSTCRLGDDQKMFDICFQVNSLVDFQKVKYVMMHFPKLSK